MKKYFIYWLRGTVLLSLIILQLSINLGCKKYLDEVSDKKLVIPSTLQDVQSLLDNFTVFNGSYPSVGGQSDDDYYILDNYYNSRPDENRRNYIWDKEANAESEWRNLYRSILPTNVALEALADIEVTGQNETSWNRLQGSSLFYRAYAYYHVVQYFAEPYSKSEANQQLGIPLRLSSDWNQISFRASLEESYQQIIKDLKEAVRLLPNANPPVTRPSKSAAYALLARTYLVMEEYDLALKSADSSLQLYNTLIDYNTVTNLSSNTPFQLFNSEVIFHSQIQGTGQLSPTNWKVDSFLYQSYDQNDLRKPIFFRTNGGFKGDYGANTSSSRFNGIAVDEVYLIRAECKARVGNKDAAIDDLNTLLRKRWKTGFFVDLTASTNDEALDIILTERRKELVARQIRWFDLRRLNKDDRLKKTLQRKIEGVIYELPANSPRYTFHIPYDVIQMTGMQQNVR